MTIDIHSILSKLQSNPMGAFNLPSFQIYQLSFFTILIFIIIGFRIGMSLAGRKYSFIRLFTGPVFLFLLVSYNYYNSYIVSLSLNISDIFHTELILIPILVGLGMAVGHRIARRDRVFRKKGRAYYRTSVAISLVWAFSFLARMGVITYLPLVNVGVGLFLSSLLDITTGLILGEALKIHRTYRTDFGAGAAPA